MQIRVRRRTMTDSKIRSAKMLRTNTVPPKEVACDLGISIPTLHRRTATAASFEELRTNKSSTEKHLMIHATHAALDRLEPLLQKIRQFEVLKEKSRGIFYYRSTAFLHFHEDATGLFADIKIADNWCRYPVSSNGEQAALVNIIRKTLELS